VAALGGLLVGIVLIGVVGIFLNQRVKGTVDEAIRYNVELENLGDALQDAVGEVRLYHRNLAFAGPTRAGLADFEGANALLLEQIGQLEELGVRSSEAPQPDEIRVMAEDYYDSFRPAIALYDTDRAAFDEASDQGLRKLDEIEQAILEVDRVGEERSAESLRKVYGATTTATLVLIAVMLGLLLVGVALSYAVARVVDELRRLYAEQQAATQKVEAASRAKTEFIADVSHELRTPLTVLSGNAQVGLALLDGDGEHKEILHEIVGESERMSRMVEELLFLARYDATSVPFELETVAVEPFMADVAGRARVLARERGAELEAEHEGEGLAEVDLQRIEQAVLILVDNATKYGPPGGKITLSSRVRAGELCIGVEDRGPGIPKEELPRIFERFYRVDKARSRRMGGAGLGLPIAKAIVEAHHGRIEAVSRPGKGTKISLCLPILAYPQTAADEAERALSPEDG
jgi:signal transduction histidine kinase